MYSGNCRKPNGIAFFGCQSESFSFRSMLFLITSFAASRIFWVRNGNSVPAESTFCIGNTALRIRRICFLKCQPLNLYMDRIVISHPIVGSCTSCQQTDEAELNCIGVLILIDHQVTKTLTLIIFQNFRTLLEKLHCLNQQIIKIESIALFQTILISPWCARAIVFLLHSLQLLRSYSSGDIISFLGEDTAEQHPFLIKFCIDVLAFYRLLFITDLESSESYMVKLVPYPILSI